MKKYKLIKKYPGSPNTLGLEIKQNGTFYHSDFCTKGVEYFHQSFNPENHPEFWEEIQEKDYQILSLYIRRAIKHDILDVENISQDYILGLLKCDSNEIHSIKRLSDGEIFTIGDNYMQTLTGKKSVIKEFIILLNKLCLFSPDLAYSYLYESEKIKQPLCKSADGLDIYEDDSVVCLDKNDWITRNENYKFQPRDVKDENYLFFSTKEAADKYILMNKPCLSINDVIDNLHYSPLKTKIKLKDLVKNKLPQS